MTNLSTFIPTQIILNLIPFGYKFIKYLYLLSIQIKKVDNKTPVVKKYQPWEENNSAEF